MERAAVVGDPRFYQRNGPDTLAAAVDAVRTKPPPRRLKLAGIAPPQTAQADQVSFLDNRKYRAALGGTPAGAGYMGFPADSAHAFLRGAVTLHRLIQRDVAKT